MTKMLYLLSAISFSLCQDIPFIDFIEPAFGKIGSTITINGSNFSPNNIDNTVFFGGLEANMLNATENELIATIPYGTYYTPISVYVNGYYAISSEHFNVIFDAAEELATTHLSNQIENPYLGTIYKSIKIGDLNGDGIVNILDVIAVVNLVLGGEYNNSADLNSDGNMDILDVVLIVNLILGN